MSLNFYCLPVHFCLKLYSGANREPDTQRKKSCVLKKINYPTGGYTEFDYESHSSIGTNFAGLRVLKITNSDGSSSPVLTNYSYEGACIPVTFDEKSYFTPFNIVTQIYYENNYGPNLVNTIFNFSQDADINSSTLNEGTYIRVTANPQAVLDGAESGLGYEKVTESKTGNGKIIYNYAAPGGFSLVYNDLQGVADGQPIADWYRVQTFYFCPYDDCSKLLYDGSYSTKDWPNLPVYSNEYKRSILKSIEYYAEGATSPTQTETYDYNIENIGNIAGYNIQKIPLEGSQLYEYFIAKYYLPYNRVSIKRKQVYDYTSNGTVAKTTRYYYNNDSYHLLNKETLYTNTNDSIETKYTYPTSYYWGSTQTYTGEALKFKLMVDRNIINIPIEKTTIKNSLVIGSELTLFDLKNNIIVPKETYTLEFTSPFTYPFIGLTYTTLGSNQVSFTKNSSYKLSDQYQEYSTKGNLLQMTARDGITTAYLWDSSSNYLMAQVKGAPYSQIIAQDGKVCSYSSNALWTDLNSLAPGAMINTYGYYPLVGLKYATNPGGTITYYDYDALGRLRLVRNADYHLVNRYKYNYKQ